MACSLQDLAFLEASKAAEIDEKLMGPLGFSIDQLMELAGLSVATATSEYCAQNLQRILVVCGPGNNGGDGLVAARHLYHFGYKPVVCYPKQTAKPLYQGLVTQLASLDVPVLQELPSAEAIERDFDVVVDAIFGFSFKGEIRAPFADIISTLKKISKPIVSVDVPSGWDVNEGNKGGVGLEPAVLISLTAPKLCAKHFKGHHFLGGRFVPPAIRDEFGLKLPTYPGLSRKRPL
ncbi:hypothetical protein GUITHDRAFT_156874 [Guillardia theta CCMP2712]|uniref:NAD(P)H-hydrate epimerase n=1 Tax=Guillardia theta (strain CCMP2712) TaxID=905079 RepID=L1K252_GUITC|nr:hypothetical protein GUITHDRAFT_156874 [Guillardia theta CCMP2712]EKX54530.1 hypothetical protein GUITHDRAFT_156874 [Guillardia theta CCMP2712]|eukprot:XP_005841510.1 hypothetical protein GUITHDRAFT_156874 [Guillardia theta CCMP2712]